MKTNAVTPSAWPPALACSCCARGPGAALSRRGFFTGLVAAGAAPLLAGMPAPAAAADPECHRSSLADLVPAADVEAAARQEYLQLMQEAKGKNVLAAADDPQLERLRYIAARMIPLTVSCNERARAWKWEVQLLRTDSLNAFCMPGGKIAFFSGILSKLKLSDDEVAIIMGHETSHALLEHARERMAKSGGTSMGLRALSALLGLGNLGDLAAQAGAQLLSLKYSRDDEGEADALGLLLAARSGYDPRAGVSLWQKMAQASAGRAPPAWLSTHPAGPDRIREIERRLPRAQPEFERAARPDRRFPAAG
ncbi:MAG: M48 family metallopeptidase [Rubrivivax sp.]|nr:M48 family metallopeptidase [Rubrivivax sp.]